MLNLDQARMGQVIQEAFDKAASDKRWQRAIVRAKVEFECNPYLHWTGDALLILSPSNELYSANGTCQCRAYTSGQACWHRAASRLMQRYLEAAK